MSNAGPTRGHRGIDRRRSSNYQTVPDVTVPVFQSQRTPSIGSSRRPRGFQPDEVNKNKEKFISVDNSLTQADNSMEDPTAIDNDLTTAAVPSKLASTMSPRSTEPLPPHRRTPAEDEDSDHQLFNHTQIAPMNESRLELDQKHFNDAKPIESETSSTQQIITERKPSCWSIASPPEAPPTPPTEWNSAAADIDKPAKRTLPIYRIPRAKHTTEREKASKSFSRQKAKLNPQATASTSKAPKSCEMNGSPRLATPEEDEVQATGLVASWEDSPATDSLNRLEQLQHDAQLDVEQASQVKMIHEDLLAQSMQASSGNQTEGNPTQDISQVRRLDVNGTKIDPSAASPQGNLNQMSTPPEKQSNAAPPHLRIQSYHHGPDSKDKPLLPHLRSLTSPIDTTATKATADDEDVEPGKQKLSKTPDIKVPPHRQGLSAAKNQATHDSRSGSIPSPISQMKDHGNPRTIDIDEEIAATQPVLDIDEEIVAALNAETSGAISVAQPTDSNSKEFNEPTQARDSSSKVKASAAQSKSEITDRNAKAQADQHGDDNHSTKTRSKENGHLAGALQDVSGKRKNANLTSASKKGAPSGAESSVKKGKKPARDFESVEYTSPLVDWDGKMIPPPVGDEWDGRQQFNTHETRSVIEAWRKEHAADPEENNRMIVNTTSADFQTGEGLAGGDVNVLSPINKMDHETHTANDDFTQARRHLNAAEAMENYKAKIAAKPKIVSSGVEGMTKDDRRALRRANREEERTWVVPPNPHAPAANIYLRPAESRDMSQVMKIYNHDVRETSFVHHLDVVDEVYWRSRLQEAEDERNPFVVAIHMGEKSCRSQGDIIRRKQENVVGFAAAADYGSKQTVYHSSVEIDLMVHQDFHHLGIGRTLMDRILAALSPDHELLDCAPFLYNNNLHLWIGGGSRQAKAIMVNVLYFNGKEDDVTWRQQWLSKYGFERTGTVPNVGFKQGKL